MVSNKVKQPKFRPIPEVAYKNDLIGALSAIPKVVMVQDVRRCYNYKIGAIGDLKIANAYENLCVDGKLEDEFVIVEKKTLTKALDFPTIKQRFIVIQQLPNSSSSIFQVFPSSAELHSL